MIELQNIRFKNIFSYGNIFTTYNFQKGITLVSGANGSGKCLSANTNISIEISDPIIHRKFLDFINKNRSEQ